MTYKTEFPHMASDVPLIPNDWKDVSWHNDACPSFEVMTAGNGDSNFKLCKVWIAESDPEARDVTKAKRFQVTYESPTLWPYVALQTDTWEDVQDYVATRQYIARDYIAAFGYNPFLECPVSPLAALIDTLNRYKELSQ